MQHRIVVSPLLGHCSTFLKLNQVDRHLLGLKVKKHTEKQFLGSTNKLVRQNGNSLRIMLSSLYLSDISTNKTPNEVRARPNKASHCGVMQ